MILLHIFGWMMLILFAVGILVGFNDLFTQLVNKKSEK